MSIWVSSTTSLFAQAYGAGTYSCGAYEEGCATALPSAPTTGVGAFLSEPSFVVPGSLLLAILLAFITTTLVKFVRRRKHQQS